MHSVPFCLRAECGVFLSLRQMSDVITKPHSITQRRLPPARRASLVTERARAKAALAAPLKNLPELTAAIDRLSQLVAQKKAASGGAGLPGRRCFATSEFKRLYVPSCPVGYQHELFASLRSFLHAYAVHVEQPESVADQMFEALQAQVFNSPHWASLLGEAKKIAEIAVVLWTSSSKVGFQKEFCSILNQVIRDDVRDVVPHAVILCRALASLIVTRREGPSMNRWPTNLVTHRGTSMPQAAVGFFSRDRMYRAPMFLATSCLESTAVQFMQRAPDGMVPVHFKFFLDPVNKCDHALYIENYTLCSGEEELLYAPYSAFKVRNVLTPAGQIAWNNPIVIELEVQPNNKTIREDVPIASWH